MRQRLSWILAGWLCVQFVGTIAPVVLVASGYTSVADVCECPPGQPGAACPMHHGATATTATQTSDHTTGRSAASNAARADDRHTGRQDENQCRLQNTRPSTDAALLVVAGALGVVAVSPALHIDSRSTQVFVADVSVLSPPVALDTPPPRS